MFKEKECLRSFRPSAVAVGEGKEIIKCPFLALFDGFINEGRELRVKKENEMREKRETSNHRL